MQEPDEGYMPKDKVFFGREVEDEQGPKIVGAIVLAVIVAILFLGIVGYGLYDGFTRERTPVTLLTPTTGG